jgi:hypothetical protein
MKYMKKELKFLFGAGYRLLVAGHWLLVVVLSMPK